MSNIVNKLFKIGAKEVHIRICAPEVKDVCYFGININSKQELVSSSNSIEQVNNLFKSTSLKFLPIKSMLNHLTRPIKNQMCTGCFDSNYQQLCKGDRFIDW